MKIIMIIIAIFASSLVAKANNSSSYIFGATGISLGIYGSQTSNTNSRSAAYITSGASLALSAYLFNSNSVFADQRFTGFTLSAIGFSYFVAGEMSNNKHAKTEARIVGGGLFLEGLALIVEDRISIGVVENGLSLSYDF